MKPLHLSDVARMTGGRLHGDDVVVDAIGTDTRALPSGRSTLFIALKGERFDGHEPLVANAATVAGALVSRIVGADLPQVLVADTERALADLATAMQRGRTTKVVAITGSNGKTSVKALLLAILEGAAKLSGTSVHATPGNRNNEIGLPLAVLDAPEDAEVAIYEMGTGKPGDIAYLTAIARPWASLVNNIAPAHLERMGSLLGIADTKAAVYDSLPPDGVAVINADDAFAPYFAERAHGRQLIRFGLEANAEITARNIHCGPEGSRFMLVAPSGEAAISLALPGRHNVRNALAAAALAIGLGIGLDLVASGLNAARPVSGRLVTHRLANGAVLIDDSYNANPGSLAAAIETMAAPGVDRPGQAWLVLGDMRELGDDASAMHAEAGRRAKAAGIARLYTLGTLSASAAQAFGEGARSFDGHDALATALRHDLAAALREPPLASTAAMAPGESSAPGVRVLVKGSRGSAMDRIVRALLDDSQPAVHPGGTDAA